MESAQRDLAPGDLVLVQEFVNTRDIETGQELLGDPDALRQWLTARGLLPRETRLDMSDVDRAIEVREALRALLLANNGGQLDARAVAVLNDLSGRRSLVLRFDSAGRARLEAVDPTLDGPMSSLLGIIFRAMIEGTWPRLKACRKDECHWAFFDRSKNRSGRWCAMAECGNKIKTRVYRERVRTRTRESSQMNRATRGNGMADPSPPRNLEPD
jgi:predicted RNA-binding Zn ribbon-like protein